jgi:RNA polymerase sigma factor for flagellar operon FliA
MVERYEFVMNNEEFVAFAMICDRDKYAYEYHINSTEEYEEYVVVMNNAVRKALEIYIDKFDLDKGVKFRTYASLRIRGAIIDSVRNLDWIPRSLRQKSKELEKLYADLENELGRSATDEDVANKLGISTEEFGKMLTDINISSLVSLDEYFEQNYDHGISPKDNSKETQPEGFVEKNEIKNILGKSIDMLPEKEKMVVTLYYYEELTLKEISVIMNVSESRISQ